MREEIPVYYSSHQDAKECFELTEWEESYNENIECARYIEERIKDNYNNNSLSENGAKDCIKEFGYNRLMWVLSATIQKNNHDGRYSKENKDWANKYYIPESDKNYLKRYMINSHPGLVDLFTKQVLKEWDKLGLFNEKHCIDETSNSMDYTGKILVLNPLILKEEYKTPEDQLFLASGGNGCRPGALGSKIFGRHLKDDYETHYRSGNFLGVIKEEFLPTWAKEKYDEVISKDNDERLQMGELK